MLAIGRPDAAGASVEMDGHLLAVGRSACRFRDVEVLHPDLRDSIARGGRTARACRRARSAGGLRPLPVAGVGARGLQPAARSRGGSSSLSSSETSTALKATHLPSGETVKSPMRLSCIMSSKVKGRFAWASENEATSSKNAMVRRIMISPRKFWNHYPAIASFLAVLRPVDSAAGFRGRDFAATGCTAMLVSKVQPIRIAQ